MELQMAQTYVLFHRSYCCFCGLYCADGKTYKSRFGYGAAERHGTQSWGSLPCCIGGIPATGPVMHLNFSKIKIWQLHSAHYTKPEYSELWTKNVVV